MKKVASLILLLVYILSCDSVNQEESNCNEEILIDSNLFANAPDDSFSFKSVEINQNCLTLSVEYGGGCGDVEFKLIDSDLVMESTPPQRNIRLSLNDRDYCKAMITKKLFFDLTPIQVVEGGKIILHLTDWEEQILYNY